MTLFYLIGIVLALIFIGAMIYTITNHGSSRMNWRIIPSSAWINLTSSSGSLEASSSANVVVSVATLANTYPPGTYRASLTFENLTSAQGNTTRSVDLVVNATGSALMNVFPSTGIVFSGPPGGPFAFNA